MASILTVLVVASPGEGLAQGGRARTRDADGFIEEGIARRRIGDDEAALAFFARAYDLDPSARARAQMALAEQALGLHALAEEHLEEALDDDDNPWIVEHRPALEESLANVRAALERERAAAREAEARARVAASPPPPPARPRPRAREPEPEAASPHPHRASYIVIGSGGALVATSVVAYGVRERAARTFNGEGCLVGDATRGERCGDEHDRAVRSQRVAGVSLGLGASLAVTGIVLRLVRGRSEDADDARAAAPPNCAVAVGETTGGACTWQF